MNPTLGANYHLWTGSVYNNIQAKLNLNKIRLTRNYVNYYVATNWKNDLQIYVTFGWHKSYRSKSILFAGIIFIRPLFLNHECDITLSAKKIWFFYLTLRWAPICFRWILKICIHNISNCPYILKYRFETTSLQKTDDQTLGAR